MFVFALVFRYFAVPLQYQHRVLFYGVLGAMVFRGVFIAAGSALIRFEWVLIVFGLFLVDSGIRLAVEREKPVNPNQSWLIRIIGRRLYHKDGQFYGTTKHGKFMAEADATKAGFKAAKEPAAKKTKTTAKS
jgi:tellurite resistance protein TerC